ncbi:hypothetical protein ACH5RR_039058 [Cinchona calisaya]|uniref:Uncharacterized protein n=1 Tax=Cinchona calisaya TaxID=153742 RepID=A0ABD2Y178_9GENT
MPGEFELEDDIGDDGDRNLCQELETRGSTLDGPESSDNTILGPSQFELVAHNLGKPSDVTPFFKCGKEAACNVDVTPFLNVEKSVTTIMSEQHYKAALGIGERIQRQILGTSFWRLLEYSDRKLTEAAFSTRLAAIQRQIEEASWASEQKLRHLESIQAKRLSLEGRKVELMKELE